MVKISSDSLQYIFVFGLVLGSYLFLSDIP